MLFVKETLFHDPETIKNISLMYIVFGIHGDT